MIFWNLPVWDVPQRPPPYPKYNQLTIYARFHLSVTCSSVGIFGQTVPFPWSMSFWLQWLIRDFGYIDQRLHWILRTGRSYFFTYWSNYKSWQFVLFFQKENPHLSQGICIPAPAGKFSHWKMSVPKTFVKSQQNNSTLQCLIKLIQNQNYNFHHKKTSTKSSGPMFVCYSYWETILPEITLNCYNKCKIVEMYHGENVSLYVEDRIYEMFMLENWRPQCLVQFPSNLVQTILFQSFFTEWILKIDNMFKMKKKFWIQSLCVVKVILQISRFAQSIFCVLGKN